MKKRVFLFLLAAAFAALACGLAVAAPKDEIVVGTASDATVAMELGCAAVLMNTAIAKAQDPIMMARAMKAGVEAGRLARLAGRMPRKYYAATPSSPTEGLLPSVAR